MSHPSDDEIISALRTIVPDPPEAPARLATVRHRATARRRRQVAAGSLTMAGVVAAGVVLANQQDHTTPATQKSPGGTAPALIGGLPAVLHRPLHLPTVAAGQAC